jgi:hypothetical protein
VFATQTDTTKSFAYDLLNVRRRLFPLVIGRITWTDHHYVRMARAWDRDPERKSQMGDAHGNTDISHDLIERLPDD